jgi:putative DNA methylase
MPGQTETVVRATAKSLAPFSLKNAPSLIERVFPAQKVGIEAQKERKAGAGQTLTALGSYWKGRKPLVLVRACVLASLLPATEDPEADLSLFEALMRMDADGISRRDAKVTAQHVMDCAAISSEKKTAHVTYDEPPEDENAGSEPPSRRREARWRRVDVSHIEGDDARDAERARIKAERQYLKDRALLALPFSQQVGICERVERVEDLTDPADPLYAGVLSKVNARLGTDANTLPELVEQLGIARFGHRPVIGDPFCGGGSIPFEAARVGCDVVASDLNPVAAMLTWGALNIIGADADTRERIASEQGRVA